MKGYESIESMSLMDCHEFLTLEDEKNPKYHAVKTHYYDLLEELALQDASDFAACKTPSDYVAYVEKYSKKNISSCYKAKHIDEAKTAIEEAFWKSHGNTVRGCKEYLSKYPKGRHTKEANDRIGGSKKSKWVVFGIVLTVLIIAFYIGYKPVNNFSVDATNLCFDKWGEHHEINVSTNVSTESIDFNLSGKGFEIDENGYSCKISASPNEGDTRTGSVKVSAYATWYGMRIGEGKSISVDLSQKSGLATRLDVSISSISSDKWGDKYSFTAKTDGVKLEVVPQKNWIISEQSYKQSGEYRYTISIEKNPGDSREGKIVVKSGNLRKEIDVTQASGLASKLSLNKSSIKGVDRSGTEEGKCYRVNVTTDGTTWRISSKPDWVKIEKYDNFFEIEVTYNYDDIRDGYIYVNSNKNHTASIYISQDGDPTSFYPDYSSRTFDTDGGNKSIYIYNNSRQPISVSTDKDWLSAYMSGDNVRIFCEDNPNSPRDGMVTLKCGSKKTTISVHQKGWGKCNSCDKGRQSCPNGYKTWGTLGDFYKYEYYYGTHYLTRQYVDYFGNLRTESQICTTCGGKGYITCKSCGGKGKIKRD